MDRGVAPQMVLLAAVALSACSPAPTPDLPPAEWQEWPPDWGFNPAVLFDPETGIQAALVEDLSGLVLLGTEELEEIPGQSLYHLQGLFAGERLSTVSHGMIGPEAADAELWIAPGTFEVYRMILVEPGEQEDTIWTIDFWDFDKIHEILPPLPGDQPAE